MYTTNLLFTFSDHLFLTYRNTWLVDQKNKKCQELGILFGQEWSPVGDWWWESPADLIVPVHTENTVITIEYNDSAEINEKVDVFQQGQNQPQTGVVHVINLDLDHNNLEGDAQDFLNIHQEHILNPGDINYLWGEEVER